ncbi:acylphosphatase [Nautilia sp. PV-1]|uniref:acylphosphatase n=1 Tax=Nautilia sp. PV-1 TaxID=2579250 RepID=UPI000FD8538A|nr:acylphosphatase [Nautilia sp. PV-1]AZV46632.1 acylphosphatase [Nautilia sp. PV-1]
MTYRFIVSGRVQGVWYRKFIQQNAKKAGFKGYVKNLPDGTVEAVADIENEEKLKEFLNILKEGSPYSEVKDIEVEPLQDQNFDDFEIRY